MQFYSSGKLMLTSEYVVLGGAQTLAVPTRLGQFMEVEHYPEDGVLHWSAIDHTGFCWFIACFDLEDMSLISTTYPNGSDRLVKLLEYIKNHSSVLDTSDSIHITTILEFDRNWGLGSSSTLVANLAKWSGVDPIKLMHAAFKGSGYDVAVGMENAAIVYDLNKDKPNWSITDWAPSFSDRLFFVYLGQKQNSEKEVMAFEKESLSKNDIDFFDQITNDLMMAKDLSSFESLIAQHEERMAQILNRHTVKERLFADYSGAVKSLGAWGGDFVLATGCEKEREYFVDHGFATIISWNDMIASGDGNVPATADQ
jgi:mevalonate kinase